MPTRNGWLVGAAYAALVALLVAATLSGGSIFFQVTEHGGHAHADLVGWQASLPLGVDTVGLLLMLLLSVQMMFGYRLFRLTGRQFRPVHVALAWTVVGLMALHGAGGIYHTVSTGLESLPLWINVCGLGTAALLVTELTSGYRQSKSVRFRRIHFGVAVPIALIVAVHGVLGVLHTFTG